MDHAHAEVLHIIYIITGTLQCCLRDTMNDFRGALFSYIVLIHTQITLFPVKRTWTITVCVNGSTLQNGERRTRGVSAVSRVYDIFSLFPRLHCANAAHGISNVFFSEKKFVFFHINTTPYVIVDFITIIFLDFYIIFFSSTRTRPHKRLEMSFSKRSRGLYRTIMLYVYYEYCGVSVSRSSSARVEFVRPMHIISTR